MISRVVLFFLSFFLLTFLSCKDSPVSPEDEMPSDPANKTLVILNQIESDFENFEKTYFKSIVESNGLDKLWIRETEEIWKPNLIVKDTVNNQVRVYLKITSSGTETFEHCDNFYTNNCSLSEANIEDTLGVSFNFYVGLGKITIGFPSGYTKGTDSIFVEENNLPELFINYNFFENDSSQIVFGDTFQTVFNPVGFIQKINSKNGSPCAFWKFELNETIEAVQFDSQNHKIECAPDISSMRTQFDNIFVFEEGEILEFNKEMGSYAEPYDIYDWDFKASEYWKVEEKYFNESELIGNVVFQITSFSNERTYYYSPDTTYERFSRDTSQFRTEFIFDFKNNRFEFDYDESQVFSSEYFYPKHPGSIDFRTVFSGDQQINYSYYDVDDLSEGYSSFVFEFKPGTDSLFVQRFERYGTSHNHSDWWLRISKTSGD